MTISCPGYKLVEERKLPIYLARVHEIISTTNRYTEATPTLYSSNTFGFHENGLLLRFPATIVPQHWHAIRNLHLSLWIDIEVFLDTDLRRQMTRATSKSLDKRLQKEQTTSMAQPEKDLHIHEWNKMWRNIAEMQGLQNLDVHVRKEPLGLYHISHEVELTILTPLLAVKQTKTFRVAVAWELALGERVIEDTPFHEIDRSWCQ